MICAEGSTKTAFPPTSAMPPVRVTFEVSVKDAKHGDKVFVVGGEAMLFCFFSGQASLRILVKNMPEPGGVRKSKGPLGKVTAHHRKARHGYHV